MSYIKEYYHMAPMAANASRDLTIGHIFGFLAVASGTLTVTDGAGNVLINALPVSAGVFTPFPGSFQYVNDTQQAKIQLAGGAAGTLFL